MAETYDPIINVTQDVILPKVQDNIFDDAPVLRYIHENKVVMKKGGTQLQQPVRYKKSTQGGSYGRGDTLDSALEDVRSNFVYDWKANHQPVVVDGLSMAQSQGQAKVIDHVTQTTTEAVQDFVDELSTQFFADGTGNGSKDFTGLAAIVDDGTNVAAYGGRTRATDTWAQAGYTDSVGAIALADLQTAWRGAKSGAARKPNLIVTTEATYDDIEDLYQASISHNVSGEGQKANAFSTESGLHLKMGAEHLSFRGAPVIADEYCTSDKLYVLNTDRLFFYILEQNAPDLMTVREGKKGMTMTRWTRPTNQDALVSQLFIYGEFATSEPRAHYQLDGITN